MYVCLVGPEPTLGIRAKVEVGKRPVSESVSRKGVALCCMADAIANHVQLKEPNQKWKNK